MFLGEWDSCTVGASSKKIRGLCYLVLTAKPVHNDCQTERGIQARSPAVPAGGPALCCCCFLGPKGDGEPEPSRQPQRSASPLPSPPLPVPFIWVTYFSTQLHPLGQCSECRQHFLLSLPALEQNRSPETHRTCVVCGWHGSPLQGPEQTV